MYISYRIGHTFDCSLDEDVIRRDCNARTEKFMFEFVIDIGKYRIECRVSWCGESVVYTTDIDSARITIMSADGLEECLSFGRAYFLV